MYRRIFRSICVVALSAVLVAAALILGVVYRHLKDQAIQSLTEEAHAVGSAETSRHTANTSASNGRGAAANVLTV